MNERVMIDRALRVTLTKATNIQAGRSIRGLLAPTSWSVQDVRYAFIAPIENSRTMVASGTRQLLDSWGIPQALDNCIFESRGQAQSM